MDLVLLLNSAPLKNLNKNIMKIKLLKKVRRTVRLYERNGLYYIGLDNMMTEGIEKKEEAINEYRYRVVARARRIFGFKPKYRLF